MGEVKQKWFRHWAVLSGLWVVLGILLFFSLLVDKIVETDDQTVVETSDLNALIGMAIIGSVAFFGRALFVFLENKDIDTTKKWFKHWIVLSGLWIIAPLLIIARVITLHREDFDLIIMQVTYVKTDELNSLLILVFVAVLLSFIRAFFAFREYYKLDLNKQKPVEWSSPTKFCPTCGKRNAINAKFCIACAESIIDVAIPQTD